MTRSYKWQPHDGARHALSKSLTEGDPGSTLCGIEVTAKSDEWLEAERYWPTCSSCDLTWREKEQILPWPHNGKLPSTTPPQIHEVITPLTTTPDAPQHHDACRTREDVLHGV